MKFEVAKHDLDAALSMVSHSIASSGADLSTHYLFRAVPGDDKKMEVRTHTGRVYSGCPFVASVTLGDGDDAPTAFTIEGWRLKSFLSAISNCALTFEFDGKITTLTEPGGKIRFESLDPDGFPHWDKNLKGAKVTATMNAARFAEALDFARNFASSDPSRSPHLCVCEVVKGVVASSDKQVGTHLTVPGLAECSIRVFAKDAPGILSFLALCDGDVEILEHERHAFFRRPDGAVYGESRYLVQFPTPNRPPAKDAHVWEFQVADIQRVLRIMHSAADKEDNRILFAPKEDGVIEVSMLDKPGQRTARSIECSVMESADNAEKLPEDGFLIPMDALVKFLSLGDKDVLRFGLNVRGKRGYIRIEETRFAKDDGTGGDTYVTVMAWLQ